MSVIKCVDCGKEISDSAPSCPHCGRPNQSNNKSIGLALGVGIAAIPFIFAWFTLKKGYSNKARVISFLWLFVVWVLAFNDPQYKDYVAKTKASKVESKQNSLSKNKATELFRKPIPGLQPGNIYLNLTKKGFSKKGPISHDLTELGGSGEYVSWELTLKDSLTNHQVEIYSNNIDDVYMVRATILDYLNEPSKDASLKIVEFLSYISTLPYENAEPKKAMQWVQENINTHKATTIIAKARFTLYGETASAKMLTIQNSDEDRS